MNLQVCVLECDVPLKKTSNDILFYLTLKSKYVILIHVKVWILVI